MKKILLIFLLLVISPSIAQAQFSSTPVQSDCTNGSLFVVTTYTYTFPSPITAGNIVVIGFNSGQNRTIVSILGTAGAGTTTTYTVGTGGTSSGATGIAYLAHGVAGAADTDVTIILSGSNADAFTFCFAEFSGNLADQSSATFNGAATTTGTVFDSGSVTPPTTNNLIIVYFAHTTGVYTYDADFTAIDSAGWGNPGSMHYKVQTTATAQESNVVTDGSNESGVQRIGAYAGTGAALSGVKRTLLLGVGNQ